MACEVSLWLTTSTPLDLWECHGRGLFDRGSLHGGWETEWGIERDLAIPFQGIRGITCQFSQSSGNAIASPKPISWQPSFQHMSLQRTSQFKPQALPTPGLNAPVWHRKAIPGWQQSAAATNPDSILCHPPEMPRDWSSIKVQVLIRVSFYSKYPLYKRGLWNPGQCPVPSGCSL